MQLEEYKKKSAELTDFLDRTAEISRELNMLNSSERINSIKSRLGDDVFRLVIVGEFSRGKSTFVNALLRRKILPASKKPTTAIISKIIYGDNPKFQLNYKLKNATQILSEDEFKKLTAPKDPDESDRESVTEYIKAQKFLESIDHAEISYPLEFCKDGVEVVDTPGTNDLDKARLNVTYGYLKRADAVILMLSATQPLTQSEINFLNDKILGNTINDIFFVISHKDDLSDYESENVKKFITQNLKQNLPPNVNLKNRIFLVSGLGALVYHLNLRGENLTMRQQWLLPRNFDETGFPALESALEKFLTEEKGAARLQKYRREIIDVIDTIQHDISINIGIVKHSAEEIREKVERFDQTFNEAKGNAEIISANMQSAFDVFISNVEIKFRNAFNEIINIATASLDNLSVMSTNDIKISLEQKVNVEMNRFLDKLIAEWRETLAAENKKAQTALAKIWSDIDVTYKKEFSFAEVTDNTNFELSLKNDEDLPAYFADMAGNFVNNVFKSNQNFRYRAVNVIGALGSGIGYLVTSVYNHFTDNDPQKNRLRSVREQITKYYEQQGRDLKSQLESHTRKICSNVQTAINARIDDMDRQLKEILAEKDSREQDAKKQFNLLQQKQKDLNSLAEQINDFKLQNENYIVENEQIRREFDRALVESEVELDIISPWMNSFVVNWDMQNKFEKLLKRGVTIKILYGIGDMTPETTDKRNQKTLETERQLQERFAKYPNFKMKCTNTHEKLFICDEKFYVKPSMNILSFSGNYSEPDLWADLWAEVGEVSTNVNLIREYRRNWFNF